MRSRILTATHPDRILQVSSHRYEPGYRQAPHSHDYDGITLVLRGDLEETVAGREVSASALSAVFKPAGVVHGLAVGAGGVSTLRICLAAGTLARALPHSVPTGRVSLLSAGWQWTHAGPAAAEMLRSVTSRDLSATSKARRAAACGFALTRLLRIFAEACRERPGVPAASDAGAPVWLAGIHDLLIASAPAIRLAGAARTARVHPVYLARMFRRHYGCSIGEMAARVRLRRAARLLGEPDLALADVAGESGYSDQPHLCREFRRHTGVTPLGYRRVAFGARKSVSIVQSAHRVDSYHR